MTNSAIDILERWPSRRDVWEDARIADPELQFVAVHRWFKRQSVPSKYWYALLLGAERRGLSVSANDFVRSHAMLPAGIGEEFPDQGDGRAVRDGAGHGPERAGCARTRCPARIGGAE